MGLVLSPFRLLQCWQILDLRIAVRFVALFSFVQVSSAMASVGPSTDFLNSPSRYLFRYNSFYNGLANSPTCIFTRICIDFDERKASYHRCDDPSYKSYRNLSNDLVSLGLVNNRDEYLDLSCGVNFRFDSKLSVFDLDFFDQTLLSDQFSPIGSPYQFETESLDASFYIY